MTVDAVLEEIGECHRSAPPNEASTCDWVILPILHAIGYARRDILPRVADSIGQFPDYTLLPDDTAHRWYVEAKAWKVSLEHNHAVQALNYANQNGVRWVLLTNGRTWRLYDNDVRGQPEDKLLVEASSETVDGFKQFLAVISKASVLSGSRERLADAERQRREVAAEAGRQAQDQAARRELLGALLCARLKDENSEIVEFIWEVMRCEHGLSELRIAEVADYLRSAYVGDPALTLETTAAVDVGGIADVRVGVPDLEPRSWEGDWFFNTNETYVPGAHPKMFARNVAAICGYPDGPRTLEGSSRGNRVFAYVNGRGICATGIVRDGKVQAGEGIFVDATGQKPAEYHLSVDWDLVLPGSRGISYGEVTRECGYRLPIRGTFVKMHNGAAVRRVEALLRGRSKE